MEWAEAFASWSPHELSGIPTAMQANLEVGFNLAKGWITPVTRIGDRTPVGGGVVSGPPWHLEARSLVSGVEHRVSPVCPHLGFSRVPPRGILLPLSSFGLGWGDLAHQRGSHRAHDDQRDADRVGDPSVVAQLPLMLDLQRG